MPSSPRRRLTIAILGLGGQGGGVLADWILAVGRAEGWTVQGTSVPGVAQRTGSTVYYVELAPPDAGRIPIMAQMPVPGDVDIIIASELMEIGRALLRGFCSPDRTLLIGSTHRVYAISEKSGLGDGRADSGAVIKAAEAGARRLIAFDMEATTLASGSVISSVMFGALAGSAALPFGRDAFEAAIRASRIAVASNLKGFEAGFFAAQGPVSLPASATAAVPTPTTAAGRERQQRVQAVLPAAAQAMALRGVQRLMDYQDATYADLYLERLSRVAERDRAPFTLTAEAAQYLALWMSFEDIIRVADLKIRASRMDRVKDEVKAAAGQLVGVVEFMHPRLDEVCDLLPAGLGRRLRHSAAAARLLAPLFRHGRQVETTSLGWFMLLRGLARLRWMRPYSLRFVEEQQRIETWLQQVCQLAAADYDLALELLRCQRLIKGYGETFTRGWRNFQTIIAAATALAPGTGAAGRVRRWREAALADDQGHALAAALAATG